MSEYFDKVSISEDFQSQNFKSICHKFSDNSKAPSLPQYNQNQPRQYINSPHKSKYEYKYSLYEDAFLSLTEKEVKILHQNKIKYFKQPCRQIKFRSDKFYESPNSRIIDYLIMFHNFEMEIKILNLTKQDQFNLTFSRLINKGSFGSTFYINFQNQDIVIKEILFNSNRSQSIIINTLKQYALMKLCGSLQITPKCFPLYGFDLITTDNGIYFCCEKGILIHNFIKQHQNEYFINKKMQELQKSLIRMHKLRITHNDIKPHNIIYSSSLKKLLFIDLGLSQVNYKSYGLMKKQKPRGTFYYVCDQMKQIFFSKNQEKYIDLYYNDMIMLEKTKEEITENLKNSWGMGLGNQEIEHDIFNYSKYQHLNLSMSNSSSQIQQIYCIRLIFNILVHNFVEIQIELKNNPGIINYFQNFNFRLTLFILTEVIMCSTQLIFYRNFLNLHNLNNPDIENLIRYFVEPVLNISKIFDYKAYLAQTNYYSKHLCLHQQKSDIIKQRYKQTLLQIPTLQLENNKVLQKLQIFEIHSQSNLNEIYLKMQLTYQLLLHRQSYNYFNQIINLLHSIWTWNQIHESFLILFDNFLKSIGFQLNFLEQQNLKQKVLVYFAILTKFFLILIENYDIKKFIIDQYKNCLQFLSKDQIKQFSNEIQHFENLKNKISLASQTININKIPYQIDQCQFILRSIRASKKMSFILLMMKVKNFLSEQEILVNRLTNKLQELVHFRLFSNKLRNNDEKYLQKAAISNNLLNNIIFSFLETIKSISIQMMKFSQSNKNISKLLKYYQRIIFPTRFLKGENNAFENSTIQFKRQIGLEYQKILHDYVLIQNQSIQIMCQLNNITIYASILPFTLIKKYRILSKFTNFQTKISNFLVYNSNIYQIQYYQYIFQILQQSNFEFIYDKSFKIINIFEKYQKGPLTEGIYLHLTYIFYKKFNNTKKMKKIQKSYGQFSMSKGNLYNYHEQQHLYSDRWLRWGKQELQIKWNKILITINQNISEYINFSRQLLLLREIIEESFTTYSVKIVQNFLDKYETEMERFQIYLLDQLNYIKNNQILALKPELFFECNKVQQNLFWEEVYKQSILDQRFKFIQLVCTLCLRYDNLCLERVFLQQQKFWKSLIQKYFKDNLNQIPLWIYQQKVKLKIYFFLCKSPQNKNIRIKEYEDSVIEYLTKIYQIIQISPNLQEIIIENRQNHQIKNLYNNFYLSIVFINVLLDLSVNQIKVDLRYILFQKTEDNQSNSEDHKQKYYKRIEELMKRSFCQFIKCQQFLIVFYFEEPFLSFFCKIVEIAAKQIFKNKLINNQIDIVYKNQTNSLLQTILCQIFTFTQKYPCSMYSNFIIKIVEIIKSKLQKQFFKSELSELLKKINILTNLEFVWIRTMLNKPKQLKNIVIIFNIFEQIKCQFIQNATKIIELSERKQYYKKFYQISLFILSKICFNIDKLEIISKNYMKFKICNFLKNRFEYEKVRYLEDQLSFFSFLYFKKQEQFLNRKYSYLSLKSFRFWLRVCNDYKDITQYSKSYRTILLSRNLQQDFIKMKNIPLEKLINSEDQNQFPQKYLLRLAKQAIERKVLKLFEN